MADGRTNPRKPASNQVNRPVPEPVGTLGASALGQWLAGPEAMSFPGVAGVVAGAATGAQQIAGASNLAKGKSATPIQHAALQPITGGFSLAVKPAMKAFGLGGSATELEDKRRGNLAKQGINTFQFNPGMEEKYNAVVRPDLAPDFVGFDKDGNWVNNKFATTRDESSLTGRDIDKYAVFSELFGKDWANATDENRWKVGDEVIKRGLGREHHGTFDVTADQSLLDFGKSLLAAPAATTGQKKSGTVLTPDKPKRKKQRPIREIPDSEFQPIGEPKPPRYAYTPQQPDIVTIQDYVNAITKNNSDNTVR